MFIKILCSTDLNATSNEAVKKAVQLAHQYNSKIIMLNIHEEFMTKEAMGMLRVSIDKMKLMCVEKGYCYFAVDQLNDGSFIGFIGFCYQTYESQFTPSVDIGWRLNKKYWNNGFATEGAKKCLDYGFNKLGLKNIISTTPINLASFSWFLGFIHRPMIRKARMRVRAIPFDCNHKGLNISRVSWGIMHCQYTQFI